MVVALSYKLGSNVIESMGYKKTGRKANLKPFRLVYSP